MEEMERLLKSDDVNVPDEETVVTSLLTWVSHDAATRESHLPLLLAHIRLPLVQPQVSAAKNLGHISLCCNCLLFSVYICILTCYEVKTMYKQVSGDDKPTETYHLNLQLCSSSQSFIADLFSCPFCNVTVLSLPPSLSLLLCSKKTIPQELVLKNTSKNSLYTAS